MHYHCGIYPSWIGDQMLFQIVCRWKLQSRYLSLLHGLSQWNNEVQWSTSGHCPHLKSKSGMEKSETMSNYLPPLSVWNLRCRLLYLLLQDTCTWWVVKLWHGAKVMCCQCFNCQSMPLLATPLKTNMKPVNKYIPNWKGKSFEPNLHFWGFMLYNCPGVSP